MKLNKLLLTAFAGSLLLTSCSSDDNENVASGAYDNGILVLNEGGFNAGNASVSFISNDFVVENNIFSAVNNGDLLGDTGQDIGFRGGLAYIVVNVSNKIEIVDRYTFEKVATIGEDQGLVNPRYIEFHDGNAYVTNWGDGMSTSDDFVAVIDLTTNTVTSTIPVAEGPERIVEENGKLYIAHAGGYGYGNTVTVINANNNSIVTTINVGDVPNSLEVEDGKLYVLSGGLPSWAGEESFGQLDVIRLSDNSVVATVVMADMHPSNLVIEDDKIYLTADSDIYRMNLNATALPAEPLFSTVDQEVYGVYSFAVEDNRIYVGDAKDYVSNGSVLVYSLSGDLLHTLGVGVIPRGIYFND